MRKHTMNECRMMAARYRMRSGFTLVELSIVLVIMGLLAAGVLVGRDLIQAAALRSQISEMEYYNVAVQAFRAKMDRCGGLVILSRNTTVEIGVFVLGYLGLRPGPERGPVGEGDLIGARLRDQRDRDGYMAGLFLNDALQGPALGIGLGLLHQVQRHPGPACRSLV